VDSFGLCVLHRHDDGSEELAGMRKTIDMVHEAEFDGFGNEYWVCTTEEIKAFEALVRADEREACAKVCESLDTGWPEHHADSFAYAIRARGETK
jgi:hypothetical protein